MINILRFKCSFEFDEDVAKGMVNGKLYGKVVIIFEASDSRIMFSL